LWRSRGSGAQEAFTRPGGLLLGHSPRSPAGLRTGAFPCPWSSPDFPEAAGLRSVGLATFPALPSLRQVFCCVLGASACVQFALAPCPPPRLRWPHLDNRTTSHEIFRLAFTPVL